MSEQQPNFYMMPGDPMKKLDTPGGFSYKAESTMNKLGMGPINDGHETMANMSHNTPTNDGHSPMDLNDRELAGNRGAAAKNKIEVKKEDKKKKSPKRPYNLFSDEYTGLLEGDNPIIRFGGQQKSMGGTIFKN